MHNLLFWPKFPGNPTEVEAVTTVTVVVDAPVHTTFTGGVIKVVVTWEIMKTHCNRVMASTEQMHVKMMTRYNQAVIV